MVELGPGCAYLGQVRGSGPAFTVAAFLTRAGCYAHRAPLGWQADIITTSTEGDGDEPPPTPVTWLQAILARRALCTLTEVAV